MNRMRAKKFTGYHVAFFVAVLMMICFFYSCSKEELVPEKTLYAILKEVHLSKGILGFSGIKSQYAGRDSVSVYEDIYGKYGYSRETVENTYHYYFVHKTKKLKKFYNSFIGELSAEEARIIDERFLRMDADRPEDLSRTDFRVSSAGEEDKAYFERQLMSTGLYNLSFDVKVDPSDPTFKPYFSLWIRPIGSDAQFMEPELVTTVDYIKDGNTYHITVPLEKKGWPMLIVYGYLYDTDGNPGIAGKNAIIKNLKLEYVP